MIKDIIMKNRSYRRFNSTCDISNDTLKSLVDLARLSGSAANLQPLKYIISNDPAMNEVIFSTLSWAGYLKNWDGPKEDERPTGYIVVLGDTTIGKSFECDAGISCQSILLGAVEKGLGGCIIGTVKRDKLMKQLFIPEHLSVLYVIALGEPVEKVVIEDVESINDIKYWRSPNGEHHVPKRSINQIIF